MIRFKGSFIKVRVECHKCFQHAFASCVEGLSGIADLENFVMRQNVDTYVTNMRFPPYLLALEPETGITQCVYQG